MDKLIINTTMETKEPGSSEAFKSETNTKLMKNNLYSEGSQVAHTNATLQNLSPIQFHKVHGKYIKMSDDYCTAQLKTLYLLLDSMSVYSTVFSSRPITVDEKVCLCLELVSPNLSAFFNFGFTNCDPNTITFLESVDWYKLLKLTCYNEIDKYIIFQFCVKPSGEVWCNINDTDMVYIFKEIDINVPLWACITGLHLVTSLKFIDCLNETDELKPTSLDNPPATTYAPIKLGKINQKQDMKGDETKLTPDLDEMTEENEESASTALGRGSGVNPVNVTLQDLPPVHFHKVHSAYIKMSGDYCTARLDIPDLSEIEEKHTIKYKYKCLVFSSRPIAYDEKVYLRLKYGSNIYSDTLFFGLTNCDPNNITDLKSWDCYNRIYYFLNRDYCQTGILFFCVKQSGEVTSYLSDKNLKYSLKKVNTSRPLWAVLYLPHNVTSVEFINSSKETKSEEYKLMSEEKHSSPTTNALVELNNTIDNVSNLKIDSIMAKEIPKSYEAFKPETNIDEIESPLKAKGNTTAKLVQPNSSTDVKYIQKAADYDVIHFAKIVEYQLNRLPEDKRLKCMQNVLEVLDESSN